MPHAAPRDRRHVHMQKGRTNIIGSCGGLLLLLLFGEAFDGSIQHEMLSDCYVRPQNVKLGTNS